MNVLIIPEDFRIDQYVLQPIISRMFRELGKPNAKIRVCRDPLLGGVAQATDWDRIAEIIDLYQGMIDVFLLCVDRDGNPGRRMALDDLEAKAAGVLPANRLFLAEHAWQEIEVWVLAGHNLLPGWVWQDIRADRDPKERYFRPLAKLRGLVEEPGQGRNTLTREAAGNYSRIRQLCPEDIAALEHRIEAWLKGNP